MSVRPFPSQADPPGLDQILRDTIREAVAEEFASHTTAEPTLAVEVPEAARLLRTSPDTIYRLIHEGALPTVDMGSSRRVISRKVLEHYVNRSAS